MLIINQLGRTPISSICQPLGQQHTLVESESYVNYFATCLSEIAKVTDQSFMYMKIDRRDFGDSLLVHQNYDFIALHFIYNKKNKKHNNIKTTKWGMKRQICPSLHVSWLLVDFISVSCWDMQHAQGNQREFVICFRFL